MGDFRMKVEPIPGGRSQISYRKMVITVPAFVADFYRWKPIWADLRRTGPMKQAVAVLAAYQYVTDWLGYEDPVALKSLPAKTQRTCKKLLIEIIAAGLQSGLVRFRKPLQVQLADPIPSRKAARSLVENRVLVDKAINGTLF